MSTSRFTYGSSGLYLILYGALFLVIILLLPEGVIPSVQHLITSQRAKRKSLASSQYVRERGSLLRRPAVRIWRPAGRPGSHDPAGSRGHLQVIRRHPGAQRLLRPRRGRRDRRLDRSERLGQNDALQCDDRV